MNLVCNNLPIQVRKVTTCEQKNDNNNKLLDQFTELSKYLKSQGEKKANPIEMLASNDYNIWRQILLQQNKEYSISSAKISMLSHNLE